MKIVIKINEIIEKTYRGEISMENIIFMYSLNYSHDIQASYRNKDYFVPKLRNEDGKDIEATENAEKFLAGCNWNNPSQY